MTAADAVVQKTPFSFDVSVWEFFWPLLAGARLVVAQPGGHQDSGYLVKLLAEQRVTTVHFVPSMLRAFLEEPGLASLTHLKRVVCSGEALPVDLVKRAHAHLPSTSEVHNLYGPTEAAVDVSSWHCVRGDTRPSIPIGRPVANTRLYVLDAHGQPSPIGIPGELFIAGVQVGLGYWNRPQLTAERFLPDTFGPVAHGRMYRTGDLARWASDGTLEYLGRSDFQVKLRGFRIELGDVEAALRLQPEVSEAIVTLRERASGEPRLVAYVTPATVDVAGLEEMLRRHVPEFMVPSAFVPLAAFPLAPNGKTDRGALPEPQWTSASAKGGESLTLVQQQLAAMIRELLGVSHVGLDDDFFALGGHSLLATQLMVRIRTLLGAELSLRELFESSTLARLAAQVEAVLLGGSRTTMPPLLPAPRGAELPLSFSQQRMWFVEQLQSGEAVYNIPVALRLTGPLEIEALRATFGAVVRRHEVLRTTFFAREGHPFQRIEATPSEWVLPVVDLGALPSAERSAALRSRMSLEAHHRFDLEKGPLLRTVLVRVDDLEHVLLLCMHHIVADGWSMGALLHEVAALYRAQVGALAARLPALAIQYADYAAWQRQWVMSEAIQAQLAELKAHVQGVPELELPADSGRPLLRTTRGGTHAFVIPPHLVAELEKLGRAQGATLFMVLLAAFEAVLARHSGQDDFCVGSPVAQRTRSELEPLIGVFVNTLVMRARVDGSRSFRELLARVREESLFAYVHQDVPFDRLVESLGGERDGRRSPLIQAMFVLQNAPIQAPDLPGVQVEVLRTATDTARFDLTLSMTELREGSLDGALEFSLDVFSPASAERLCRQWVVLLEAAVRDPGTQVGRLPLLPEDERRKVLAEFQGRAERYPTDVLLHTLIEAQVDRTPHAEAVRFESEVLTYAQLDARANQLAHHLRALGAGPNRLVAVCLERSLDMVVALVAVLKSGAAYVPLDPAYPRERLAGMLEDAQAPVLLTHQRLLQVLPRHSAHGVCLDTEAEVLSRRPTSRPAPLADPDSLAYVIFTSGSTGRPKGAMNAHRGIVNRLLWIQQEYALTGADAVMQKTPFSFDVSVWEFFWPLISGARLVVARPGGHQDPGYLVKLLAEQRVTTVHFVPSMLRVFLEEPGLESLTHLERVVCSGEALPVDLVKRAHARLPATTEVFNLYGPTEAAVEVSFWHCVRGDTRSTIPIGRPVANTRLYVLDAQGQPCPIGVPGELFIGGVQVGQGYWNRPQLTAERFVPDPFGPDAHGRMYRTGDLARWASDGAIEYLGRADFQVKLRGFRIELGEIEAALLAQPTVREAVVLVREDTPGDPRLVAYVVATSPELDTAALQSSLGERLPTFMVPAHFVVLSKFPLSPSGKLDRKALPAPVSSVTGATPLEPTASYRLTPFQQRVAAIFRELLRVETVGPHDNFFALGGHSLIATQVVSRLRSTFGVELPVKALFDAPSVARLTEMVEEAMLHRTAAPRAPTAQRLSRDGELPLSFAQQRLWLLDQLQPGRAEYNIVGAMSLEGALDQEALRRALDHIVSRHESLRVTFHLSEGTPIQVVHPHAYWVLPLTDLTTVPPEALQQATERFIGEEASTPFELASGPLLRTHLLKLEERRHVLVLAMHHIVSDGWSLGVLRREVVETYEAFTSGRTPSLPPLPMQYIDFAAWQRQQLQGETLAREVDWWKQRLMGAPMVLEIPTDRPRPTIRSARGGSLPIHLSRQQVAPLFELAQRSGATPFMALASVWLLLLSRYSRQEDLLVGSPIAGRRSNELEGLIGFFVNTLVLRARVHPRESFRSLLAQVREMTLAAYEHQDVPFEKLVEELQPQRDLSRNPLVQVVVALQNMPVDQTRIAGLTLRTLDVSNDSARFDLGLITYEDAGALRGVIEYSADLFTASTVERLGEHLRTLVEAVGRTPDAPLSSLDMVPPDERQRMLVAWNDTTRPYDSDGTVAQVFSRYASLRPSAVALEAGDERVTYGDLEARANRLAHTLRARGVGPDTLVAVCLERGVELIVSLLAILKAGGAYVPLDASYPGQRLAYMLEDAKPLLLLTSRALRERLSLPAPAPEPLFPEELDLSDAPVAPPDSVAGPRQLAYVIFTSGSTGRPKGVGIENRGLLRLCQAEPYVRYGTRETGILLAPISFDGSVMEIWPALLNGGRLVLYPADALPSDLARLGDVLERHGVTYIHLPSGLFSQLVEHRPDVLRRLREVHVGGDVLSATHARRMLSAMRVSLTNGYGPTECSVVATAFPLTKLEHVGESVPIGRPIANTQVYVLDADLHPVPIGVPGELFLGGEGLARGYVSRPALTAERFIPHPFATTPGERLYRTGDLVRWRSDGVLEFIGRADHQVKVRGFRIELSEVETALRALPTVNEAVAIVREDVPGDKRLVAYVTPRAGQSLDPASLRVELRQQLPEYMVPSILVALEALPVGTSGKVERAALPVPDAESTGRKGRFIEPSNPLEQQIAAVWAKALGTEHVGIHDHLFEELGGTSLTVVRIATSLREALSQEIPVVWLFEYPTVHGLATTLERQRQGSAEAPASEAPRPSTLPAEPRLPPPATSGAIAIIGMAGRFPGAGSVTEFWRNLRDGVESISRFTDAEVERPPGLPADLDLRQHPAFVPAGGVLDGVDLFDPAFFDMSPREAQWLDPQQRLFLQTAWTALEDAGVDPDRFPGAISLHAGAIDSGYADAVRASMPIDGAALFELYGTATHTSLATKTSYKLGLTGESVLINTACSTGLVAVHLACQNLLSGAAQVALAGATRLSVPQRTGYVYQEGMILSPDGHCRPFDAQAQGTVTGNGVACIVLKRLEDAVRDGDSVYAVIRATATNNDGRDKSGFTAPSVAGQAAVIRRALALSGVKAEDIAYVETHGTATPLGDPIEVAALQRAYGLGPQHRGSIALASLKSNVGHLDTVAGLAGLMKAALALHHGEVPPSLHYQRPNPRIDFDATPFFVNTTLRPWPRSQTPRRAAVSSFGIGGTNAHAILEESPMPPSGTSRRSHQVFVLSARSPEALEAASRQLAAHAEALSGEGLLADAAFTHAVGRKAFEHRRAVVAHDAADLHRQLLKPYTPVKVKDLEAARRRRVAFIFPGQGTQQLGMGRDLYDGEPRFRASLETCLGLLPESLRERVHALIRAAPGTDAEHAALLGDTRVALPALFAVEYSLARLWMDWGLRPHAVLGHSFGEYAAACIAGVLSLEDGLKLAVARGDLMHRMPPGGMLAVALPESQVLPLLSGRLSLAAVNGPDRCVVSGPAVEVERLQARLKAQDVGVVRMPAPHAFHSADVEPLMPELERVVASLRRAAPSVRYVSSVTGRLTHPGELAAPRYWADQMRQPVRFADAVGALLEDGCSVLLEVGPGQDLTPLVRTSLGQDQGQVKALATLKRGGATPEHASLLATLGELWTQGLEIDWSAVFAGEPRQRLHLPTYPFQERRVWVEPPSTSAPRVQVAHVAAAEQPPLRMTADGHVPRIDVPPAEPSGGSMANARAPVALEPPITAIPMPPHGVVSVAPASVSAAPALAPASLERPAQEPTGRADRPRGNVEERLAALWRARLGVEFVGRDDDFLEIGGNSLMAAQLLNQVREEFGVQFQLAVLFEAPTVSSLARRIEPLLSLSTPAAPSREQPLAPVSRVGEVPLSFVQERVWRLEQYLPGLSAYNIPVLLRLDGDLDVPTMERALQEVVQRHEALRTTYDTVDGRPVQRFHASFRIPLPVVEVHGATPEAREVEAMRLAREDAGAPYDLVRGPVVRTTLLRLEPRRHILIAGIHHVVSDTLSMGIFLNELGQLYAAIKQGRPSGLQPLPVQYADFGAWQRRGIRDGHLVDQEKWWRTRLAGMPRRIDVPTDRPRPENSPLTSVRMPVAFSPTFSRELTAFGKREGFTPYLLVLAGWQALLHRYSGQTDIVVGTPIANRTRPELLPLIGYVAHSVAFRTSFGDDPTFRELLVRVRQELNEVQSRPDVPFEYLSESVLPGKDIHRGRMTDTVFVYHNALGTGAGALEMVGVRASMAEIPDGPVQWGATLSDLTLVLGEEPGQIRGALEYATELFDERTARGMMAHLEVLLASGLANPDARISNLGLGTAAERADWPAPLSLKTSPTSVPAQLDGRATRHSRSVAASQGEHAWTWDTLSARAHAIARRLLSMGLRNDEPVAVCLPPSPTKLAVLWGILEAGGAVVTVSPSGLSELSTYAAPDGRGPLLVTRKDGVASARLDPSRVLYEESLSDLPVQASGAGARGAGTVAWLMPQGPGRPAWVLGAGELAALFDAMDERLRPIEGGTWVAATEPTADCPELEQLWALSRGLRVTFPSERVASRLVHLRGEGPRSRAMDMSLIYFANDEDSLKGPKYELLIEGAKFADAHGFSAVWTPERHFHSFGGLYPQPAVVAAALATVTRNLKLRSGSVVLPLHDPMQVAEQWSVVDNLSNGRVGLSVATGWHVADFTFAPQNFENRRDVLVRHLETLRALWRGAKVLRTGGGGAQLELALRPKPVQRELPVWLTASSSPETFRLAGELGAGVLTGLLAQSLEDLKRKVALYRDAWRRNGHAGRGHITLMLHAFIGDDEQEVLRQVRAPLLSYFRSSAEITASLLATQGLQGEIDKVSEEDIAALLEHTFEHHAKGTGLIGTVDSGLKRLLEVREADVDEVACLIDFGLETPVVLEGLRRLARLRERLDQDASTRMAQVRVEGDQGVEELLSLTRGPGAVFLHTSARLARTLSELPVPREALGAVGVLVLEGASVELATSLHRASGIEVLLAGSPVSGAMLPRSPSERLPKGLRAWVLDPTGRPVPVGVVGELAVEGAGLPSGLWKAEDEERRRLVKHPTGGATRLLRTGTHGRLRADGRVERVQSPAIKAPGPTKSPTTAPAVTAPPATPTAIPRAKRDGPLPLSFAQQRLWYLQQLSPKSTAYNNGSSFRLTGPLDVGALQASLTELVRRHEVLRTTYRLTPEGAVQVIHPEASLPMPLEDVPGETREAREAEMLRRCLAHAHEVFDLETGPVVRARLLRMGPEEHVVAFALHHVVSDAWCNLVLARELGVLYTCFSAGRPSPLPELPVQYADYAVWQREWLEGAVLDGQLRWWTAQLTDVPALELPTDRPRPAIQAHAGAILHFVLGRDVVEPVLALGRREGATSFMVMLALYQVLLGKHAGQEDFAIGVPTAGRTRPEVEGLIGCFVNTLALRTQLVGDPSFRELLSRVKSAALAAFSNQDTPFERLIEALRVPRDQSRTPVFQVSLNVVNTPPIEATHQSFSLSKVDIDTGTSKFDLNLDVFEEQGALRCSLEYATSLFEAATVERLAARLAVLARVVAAQPDLPLSQLSLMTEDERRRVLVEWNDTAVDTPREASIPALFARQVADTPHAVALASASGQYTYAELAQRSARLANHLRSLGVRRGSRVGLAMERSAELIVGMLGVLEAGAAYVPLDPGHPPERLSWILREAGVDILVTQQSLDEGWPGLTFPPVLIDADWDVIARQPATAPTEPLGGDDLAYVMFTSGSTGQPKGVCVPHRGVTRLVRGSTFMRMGPEEVFLHLAPAAFDASTLEVWGALLNGGRLVIAPSEAQSVEALGALLVESGITSVWLTAALFDQVVQHQGEALAQVRQVLAGGDVLPVRRVREHLARVAPDAVLINGYGPTENTTFSTTHTLRAGAEPGQSVPIGRPLSNSTAYVLDGSLQLVPPGIPGELFVGGAGLAWGYLNRSDLTAERFVPHPFSATPGARLYRTGDRVRWREDGTLEFLGRVDFQLKIRGFRIEPGEVEAVIGGLGGVREVVVIAREDLPGDKRLVAYVVPEEDDALEVGTLKALVQRRLPEYMVPSAFVLLAALPLSPNGKVDRKALPPPEQPAVSATPDAAPRNETETRLAAIWAEVLHQESVGIHDDFFELGGHSLLATQVVSRIRAVLGVELPLGDLFGAPTVAKLAERLSTATQAKAPTLQRAPRTEDLPLSFAQQRLWFVDQLQPGTTVYNNPFPLRLRGTLDEAVLRRTFEELVRRHEALRTTFANKDGQPVQKIHAASFVPMQRVDLSRIAQEAVRRAEALRLVNEEVGRSFDLSKGPLIRTLLLKLQPDEHILVLHVHHIVSDGWSLGVFKRELSMLYEAFRKRLPSPLPELPVQYADYAVWQRKWLSGATLAAEVGWWKQALEGAPVTLDLPVDKPRPAVFNHQGDVARLDLSLSLTEALEALAQREGVTSFMLLLAVFHTLLHRYSGQEDILVGSPIANRNLADTEGLIGFFVNTLVLRARPQPTLRFRELLKQVRDDTLGAYEHQAVPFEKLVEELLPTRDARRSPLFQVMFSLLNTPAGSVGIEELVVEEAESDVSPMAMFELSLHVSRGPGGFSGVLSYGTDLFAHESMERFCRDYERLLQGIVTDVDSRLGELPLAGPAQQRQPVPGRAEPLSPGEAPRAGTRPPLSFAQQRLWFLEQLQPGTALYNMPAPIRFSGSLALPKFQRAADELVRRHESLRTSFHEDRGEPYQVIHPATPGVLSVVDLSRMDPEARRREVERRVSEDANQPFDLAVGPLLRMTMLVLEPTEHVLMLCMHHSISDAWSQGLLARELLLLYDAFSRGAPSPFPELTLQYADYATWQREWLRGDTLKTQLDWWKTRLAGAPVALELLTDRPRPAVRSHRGAAAPVTLSRALSQDLETLAQRESVTPFMLLLAGFQALLHRHSGQEDVLVGSPIAGRRHAGTEVLIGFFVNTLVLRARFSPTLTFRELLAQARDTTLGAFDHQDVPFERLVEEIQPARDLGRTPLFQVVFNFQNTPDVDVQLPDLTLRGVEMEHALARFELELAMVRMPDGYRGALVFDTDLFDRTTAERLVTRLQLLLEAAVANPDAPVSGHPLLTRTERHAVLTDWNRTHARGHPVGNIAQHFSAQVQRAPDAVALVLGRSRMTYAELDARSTQLANHLLALGVGLEARVGVCLHRSFDMVVGLLAILKVGAAYVPVDPSHPAPRRAFVLDDANVSVLLTQEALADTLSAGTRPVVRLDSDQALIARRPREMPYVHIGEEHLAYVTYTSGSTGQPKGVEIAHRGVLRLVQDPGFVYLDSREVLLQLSPLAFDASTFEIWGALLNGAQLVLHPHATVDLDELTHTLSRHQVTVLWLTAALFDQVQRHRPEALTPIRQVLAGGDVLSVARVRERLATGRPLVNGYGPTENTTFTTTHHLASEEDLGVTVPIGHPVHHTQVYVLDDSMQPVPVGMPGELYVGGAGLARGYTGQPALTAERFVPHPFATTPGERLYRTGDRASWRPDGTLMFLGRVDSQVKLRGFRVEPGEVEAVLRGRPEVGEAVVLVREVTPGDKRLVAYVTSRSSQPLDVAALRSALQQLLPEYLVPSHLMVLDRLPLTTHGKVDTRALPEPTTESVQAGAWVAPRDMLELRLARLWEEVLGLPSVGVRSSFFDLGGHSLLAVRLMAEVGELVGRKLPLATLFQAPTIEQLAEWLRRERPSRPSSLVPFGHTGVADRTPFFCVHPVGGNVLCYAELARLVGTQRPFYGLQAQGVDGDTAPRTSIEAMAAAYVEAVQEVQPRGPYLLGGWSLGGVVAYEMARQLRARGETVGLLAVFDAYAPRAGGMEDAAPRLHSALLFAKDLMGASLATLELDVASLAGREPDEVLGRLLEAGLASGALPRGMDLSRLRALFEVFEAHHAALLRYGPRPLSGRTLLFEASEVEEGATADRGWAALVGAALERHVIPGDHYALLRGRGVQLLAERLKEALEHVP
nr:non-ribosomal peptide synthase/polyketide synthase [Myxococcus dinghuensis]